MTCFKFVLVTMIEQLQAEFDQSLSHVITELDLHRKRETIAFTEKWKEALVSHSKTDLLDSVMQEYDFLKYYINDHFVLLCTTMRMFQKKTMASRHFICPTSQMLIAIVHTDSFAMYRHKHKFFCVCVCVCMLCRRRKQQLETHPKFGRLCFNVDFVPSHRLGQMIVEENVRYLEWIQVLCEHDPWRPLDDVRVYSLSVHIMFTALEKFVASFFDGIKTLGLLAFLSQVDRYKPLSNDSAVIQSP
ncbi:hypothetical protein RFI_09609 [Reticulomyxa filosa]|uniref:Uncharacterized protein n=1 Tax=Reticulomyxa filosa TaxID=46433 RepID=X6NNL9_RETFI|nr:hypothetical protein RFI_09609 [Reticulomyxa filosa]|eukprot:ETO27528.1 hypothetical protein RFI_09609 [Reticulomyxa filosa]